MVVHPFSGLLLRNRNQQTTDKHTQPHGYVTNALFSEINHTQKAICTVWFPFLWHFEKANYLGRIWSSGWQRLEVGSRFDYKDTWRNLGVMSMFYILILVVLTLGCYLWYNYYCRWWQVQHNGWLSLFVIYTKNSKLNI